MQKWLLTTLFFLLPLSFWTLTANFFTTPKQITLVVAVILLVLIWVATTFSTKVALLSTSPLRYGLLSFNLVIIASLIIYPLGRIESLSSSAGSYFLFSLIAYFLTIYAAQKVKISLILGLITSSALLSLHTIAQLTFLYRLTSLPLFMQSRAFTLTGYPLTSFSFIFISMIVSSYLLLKFHKFKSFFTVTTAIQIVALVALGLLLLPGGELALNQLPLRASWNVALDGMKSAKSLFIGIGQSEFPNFYNSVKPLYLNATSFWNILPHSSSSEILGILTTLGLLGLFSFLSLSFLALKSSINHDPLTMSYRLLLILSLLALTFTSGSIPVLALLFMALGVLAYQDPIAKPVKLILPIVAALFGVSVAAILGYFTYLYTLAEMSMRQAQIGLSNSDGKTVYESHLKAITLLPSMTSYHLSYSQVNLSLASALTQQKKDAITEAERKNVAQLISQAVREAKVATSLNPNSSLLWQNLGNIYKNLIGSAEGVDKLAVESYGRAVALDRGNPSLHVEYGSLLYQIKEYPRAKSEFQTAIQLKPDLPSAYYNLSKLLDTEGDYESAITVLQKAISLVEQNSPDLDRLNSELTALQAKATP